MMSSVVGRAAFSQLRADGHRYRSGPIRCRFVATGQAPRLAFAIGRKFGSAVQRNRARRRLDAAIDTVAHRRELPAGDFLFTCSASVLQMDFGELVENTERLFEQVDPDSSGVNASGASISGVSISGVNLSGVEQP